MKIAAIYILVIAIWSTTPMAIYYSNIDFGPTLSLALRISLGVLVVFVFGLLLRRKLVFDKHAILVWFTASLGIFPSMLLVYWASQLISTGLVSVMFSSSPFFVGLLAKWWLNESLGLRKVGGTLLAFVGLIFIFLDQMRLGSEPLFGLMLMVLSTGLFSASAVALKRLDTSMGPLTQSGGSMLFAMPGVWLCWFFVDGHFPVQASVSSVSALAYLALVGSVVGFSAYYFLIKALAPGSVSLMSMISPVVAIFLGVIIRQEQLGLFLLIGVVILLLGLGVYAGVFQKLMRLLLTR